MKVSLDWLQCVEQPVPMKEVILSDVSDGIYLLILGSVFSIQARKV